ncbi:MAG: SDR family oxidoreductase [Chloroflexi bacterium]|nr:SDR family oxidoreductase [Chloroflexota bacterium]
MAGSLEGQVGIVTGAGRGIGRATAVALAQEGMAVGLVARNRDQLAETADIIQSLGGRALVTVADVADEAAVNAAAGQIAAGLGVATLLVNNAGVSGVFASLVDGDAGAWWRTLEVNLRGPMLFSRAVLPSMIRRGSGCIVNIGSNVGARPTPGNSAYATSKAALLRFTDSLAAEVAQAGVTVIAVSPGLVHTAMTDQPFFQDFPDDEWTPAERAAEIIVRCARGEMNALSGRFLHVEDDLDRILREVGRIEAEGLYILRLPQLDGFTE